MIACHRLTFLTISELAHSTKHNHHWTIDQDEFPYFQRTHHNFFFFQHNCDTCQNKIYLVGSSQRLMTWPWQLRSYLLQMWDSRHPEGGIPWWFIRSWPSLALRCRMRIPVCHIRNEKAPNQLFRGDYPIPIVLITLLSTSANGCPVSVDIF